MLHVTAAIKIDFYILKICSTKQKTNKPSPPQHTHKYWLSYQVSKIYVFTDVPSMLKNLFKLMISPCSKLDKFILFLEYWWMSVCDVIKREQESLDFLPILEFK